MGMLIKCYVMLDALIMTDRTKPMLCPVGHPCLGRKKECTPGGEHSLKTRSLMGEAPFPPPPPTYKPSPVTDLSTCKEKNTSGYRINQAQGSTDSSHCRCFVSISS